MNGGTAIARVTSQTAASAAVSRDDQCASSTTGRTTPGVASHASTTTATHAPANPSGEGTPANTAAQIAMAVNTYPNSAPATHPAACRRPNSAKPSGSPAV